MISKIRNHTVMAAKLTLIGLACQASQIVAPNSSSAAPGQQQQQQQQPTQTSSAHTVLVIPHDAPDPNIRSGDFNNIVVYDRGRPQGNLLLFTGGAKAWDNCYQRPFFETALAAGYRCIALDWVYAPPATEVCPRCPDELCYSKFRSTKLFGDGSMPELNISRSESIVNRAYTLLKYLQKSYPNEGWDKYISGSAPDWEHIAVSGHSQSSGMAAYLAKKVRVGRVILFSSPKDHFPKPPHIASWLSEPSARPAERWYGAYHQKEGMADWMGRCYQALNVPPSHIRVFNLEPVQTNSKGDAYHHSTVCGPSSPRLANGDYAYRRDWAYFLGSGTYNQ